LRKKIAVLGSTGSIGVQALEVARLRSFDVLSLSAHSDIKVLEDQIREFKPKYAAVADEKAAKDLKLKVADTSTKILSGPEGVSECANLTDTLVLNGIVGMAGLIPTLTAIEAGNDVALANKESLVAAGELVMGAAKKKNVSILPVDSEHSAIFQCIQGKNDRAMIKRLILTASGGPFFGKKREELVNVSLESALKHPNWSMGAKITVDSATMMNKGLELIEAVWLFGVKASQIDVVVHRQSVIHSMVEFSDNSVLAQLGVPDMRIPIQYALTYPERFESPVKRLDLCEYGKLTFERPDHDTFRGIELCRQAIEKGGLYPATANSANEAANELFRQGKIGFLAIGELVEKTMQAAKSKDDYSLQDVLETDKFAREYVLKSV
ncbi:MAG TPA: 1-deoxy-D-xylulose-5-phosphate reductoisomerase, partial [Oscillospiraceae bacterium]|nr:1-deoxy-D-xylulose-5-phosphate reductoisomerase [Oscillospiraceae bacterium]